MDEWKIERLEKICKEELRIFKEYCKAHESCEDCLFFSNMNLEENTDTSCKLNNFKPSQW